LQQKLKKEVSWSWATSDLMIVQNFKMMCRNLHVLNLPNEGDDLMFATDASNQHCSAIFKIKEREKLCKYCSGSFNKAECNYPMKKKSLQS